MIAAELNTADIPWVALAPFILTFIVGLVLLLAGRRVMRTAFTGAGLIIGAALGWVLAETVDLSISPWIVIAVPAIVFAAVASLAYKLAIAVVMAGVLGIAAPLALITAGEAGLYELPAQDEAATATNDDGATSENGVQLPPELENALPEDVAEWLRDLAKEKANGAINGAANELLGNGEDDAATDDAAEKNGPLTLSPEAQEQVDRATAFVKDIYAQGKVRWDNYPQSLRYNLLLSALVGALLGLLIGALVPTFSSSIAGAGAGSAICLVTASVVAAKFGAAEAEWMPNGTTTWLIIWLVLAIIGLTIQWTTRPKPVDKAG